MPSSLLLSAALTTTTRSLLHAHAHALRRALHASARRHDAASPTKLFNILEGGLAPAVQVRSVTRAGVELQDGLVLPGPCIFLDGQVFMWRTPTSSSGMASSSIGGGGSGRPASPWNAPGWGTEHFEVFEVVVPKPEILLFGTGSAVFQPPPSIRNYLTRLGIQVDVFDTWNACTTYNLLSEEGRRVAAALL